MLFVSEPISLGERYMCVHIAKTLCSSLLYIFLVSECFCVCPLDAWERLGRCSGHCCFTEHQEFRSHLCGVAHSCHNCSSRGSDASGLDKHLHSYEPTHIYSHILLNTYAHSYIQLKTIQNISKKWESFVYSFQKEKKQCFVCLF